MLPIISACSYNNSWLIVGRSIEWTCLPKDATVIPSRHDMQKAKDGTGQSSVPIILYSYAFQLCRLYSFLSASPRLFFNASCGTAYKDTFVRDS